jgi:ankyrin repeat protein
VERRHYEIAQLLLKAGADITARTRDNYSAYDQYDQTSLHIAALNGDVAMATLLLDFKAEVR